MRILIVEDDRLIGDGLASGLGSLGFAVDWVTDGSLADAALASTDYDAVLLDLGLPGHDGEHWLRQWRGRGKLLPVLILTARDGLDERIRGLDGGADDYLVKPVETIEIAARLRAILRRSHGRPEPVWHHGALDYEPAAKAVRWRGTPIELTARETALLELLLSNPGRVLSKPQITDKLYAFEQEIDSNALEVHVHHLRRKIDAKLVRTVRGVGYALGAADDLPALPV